MPSSPRHRSARRRAGPLLACVATVSLGLAALVAITGAARAASVNLVANGNFATGTLADWTCSAGTATVVTSPVYTGDQYALEGNATSSNDAQCTQVISVQPSSSYSLSAEVQGNYVYLGTTGDGTTDVSTWSAKSTWNQLSVSFTTGSSTTSMTIYLHGWYAQGSYYADNVTMSGSAGGSPTTSPTPTTSPSPTPTPTTSSSPPSGTMGGFAPYADMTLYPQYSLTSGATTEGTKYFNLAFITDGGTCDPEWGGVTAITDSATISDIAALRAEGGNVRVSFGGEDGNEIAQDCTSLSSLVAAYQSVINQYSLKYIDFDIEGAAVDDTSANNLRNQAIAQLEQDYPGLQVSYTLPVLPTGLPSAEVAILQSAQNDGASIAAVNLMAMDYGSYYTGDMATLAEEAATSTAPQLQSIWTSLTSAQALAKIALTPMIGVNDAGTSETLTLADATTLAKWAKANNLAWLSFWSATRDSECSGGAQSYAEDDCSSVVQTAGEFGQEMSAVYY
jgi:hypothetical protein